MNWCWLCSIFMACVGVVAVLQGNWLGLALDIMACFGWTVLAIRKDRPKIESNTKLYHCKKCEKSFQTTFEGNLCLACLSNKVYRK